MDTICKTITNYPKQIPSFGGIFLFSLVVDTKAYISSGVLEQYCMGMLSSAERSSVEEHIAEYPEIKDEFERIANAIESYAMANPVKPKDSLKAKVLLAAYQTESGAGKKYPPLILDDSVTVEFHEWLKDITIPKPVGSLDNLSFYDLPSTEAVTNFMVWAKDGHEEEEHNDFREFIVILEGHCDMYFNGEKKHYTTGEIIRIPPFVPHHAVITSKEPMVAIVQRQMIAA